MLQSYSQEQCNDLPRNTVASRLGPFDVLRASLGSYRRERAIRRTGATAWPTEPATVTFSALQCPEGWCRDANCSNGLLGNAASFVGMQVLHD